MIVNTEQIKERVCEIIKNIIPDYQEEIDLVDSGLITSLTMMNLVIALEDEFLFETEAKDMVRDNFRTASSIARMVERYLRESE